MTLIILFPSVRGKKRKGWQATFCWRQHTLNRVAALSLKACCTFHFSSSIKKEQVSFVPWKLYPLRSKKEVSESKHTAEMFPRGTSVAADFRRLWRRVIGPIVIKSSWWDEILIAGGKKWGTYFELMEYLQWKTSPRRELKELKQFVEEQSFGRKSWGAGQGGKSSDESKYWQGWI